MAQADKQFRLTGKHVLAIFAAFFGVVFAVNGYMIYLSQKSWTGLVPGNGYEASNRYNREATRARAILRKGWRTKVLVPRDGRIVIRLRDSAGRAVSGLKATALMRRPVGTAGDTTVQFTEDTPGDYVVARPLPPGAWRMDARFTRDGELQWRASAEFVVPEH